MMMDNDDIDEVKEVKSKHKAKTDDEIIDSVTGQEDVGDDEVEDVTDTKEYENNDDSDDSPDIYEDDERQEEGSEDDRDEGDSVEISDANQVDELTKKLDSEKDKFLRLYADFENYKKRTAREKTEIYAYANAPLIEKLLSVLDSFDNALKDYSDESGAIYDGFSMISNNLREILTVEGLIRIPTVGEPFNPNLHHGIATDDNESFDEDIITEEFMSGYQYKDRIIRPAMVKVNKKN
jgi:molecular chaperone GrpE